MLADGSLLDLFWTYDNVESKYLNIHARRSSDHGRHWSPLWDVGVPGQPAPPVSLADGRLAMVYVDRTAAPAIKLRTSTDGGRHWPTETELLLYGSVAGSQSVGKESMSDCWAEMSRFSVGLPATTLTAAGDLLVVYYAGSETDHTGIHWLRLAQ